MKKHKWSRTLTAVALIILISSTAGCVTVTVPEEPDQPSTAPEESTPWSTTPEPSGRRPDINYLTATPESISLGQSVTLSWDVANASTVTLQPSVGDTSTSGSVQLSPTRDTTYTLKASNAAGDSMRTLTVTVGPAVTGIPDLVITDIWIASNLVYYKIKNQGGADAESSESELYINNVGMSTDYAQPLATGQEITDSFSRYHAPALVGVPDREVAINVKVCADTENAVQESNEGNNCHNLMGDIFGYDFVKNAHLAEWRSGAGELKWPMVAGDTRGAAFFNHSALEDGRTYADALATYPRHATGGSIQGRFGEVQSHYGLTTEIEEIEVPANAKFTAKVGFKDGATATDGVAVAFGYVDPSGSVIILKRLNVYYDGLLDVVEVDLGSIAGEEVYFILRVEASGSYEQDWLVWVDPKIVLEP